jgi:colanic acid biosynthesis glycosyl transferase WcaI
MKILIYGINFAPELTGIGKYTAEMALWLSNEGHEVRVITAPPYYPDWRVWPGYLPNIYRKESCGDISVFRCPLWVPSRPSGVKRLLHLASFALSSIPVLAMQWSWKPHVVWLVEPPLACAPAAIAFARLRRARSWLHIQDYEVDAAFEMGLLKGKFLRACATSLERWIMRRFDRVSTISARMLERARTKGVASEKVISFPIWVNLSGISPIAHPSRYRDQMGIESSTLVALYSGNMGAKQGLEALAEVAAMLRDDSTLTFVFCGEGAGRADLEKRCEGLPNVHFLSLQPTEELSELLGLADIHLLPQRSGAADLVMPSKLTGMLASGRPVIAGAAFGTELAEVIFEAACGMVVSPENPAAMVAAIRKLAEDPAARAQMGRNGRQYAEQYLERDAVLRRFEQELLSCLACSTS